MLQKYFFVGVGGSGGVSLRLLRSLLAARLTDAGYHGGLPRAWQFAHIDVPRIQETRPEGLPTLPDNNYAGLAVRGLKYRDLDDTLVKRRGESVQMHVAGWRPDPSKVIVDPTVGAGRFRAVGRMILGAGMKSAFDLLKTGFSNLASSSANQEFSQVCLALTGDGQFVDQTQVVVVSSLAGGTGAGTVIDVCDLVMQHQPDAENRLAAILYTPEVFDELDSVDKDGTYPNALAALSELLNGYWVGEAPTEEESALISSAGAFPNRDVKRRGPRIMYMIGRSNGDVIYSNQVEVYRAVAKGLAALVTSPSIQDRFRSEEIGNWTERAGGPDTSGLRSNKDERPLSSFGFASVGIGLDRFARYASERLARDAIDHLLTGHWSQKQKDSGVTEQQAREQRAQDVFLGFLRRAGLREDGTHNNDVVDAVRGRTEEQARRAIADDLQAPVLSEVTGLWPANGGADLAGTRIVERMKERWRSAADRYEHQYLVNAAAWADKLQGRVTTEAAHLVAAEGAPVAAEVIQKCVEQLTVVVVPELEQSHDAHQRLVGEMRSRVKGSLAGITGALHKENPRISQAVTVALDSFHAYTEQFVYDLAAELVRDIAENVLRPLQQSIKNAGYQLQNQLVGTPTQPSKADKWPVDERTVPTRYEPPDNELVLEPVASYPTIFESRVRAQTGDENFRNALVKARREIIEGIRENNDGRQVAIESRGRWQPRDRRLPQSPDEQPAEFLVHIDDDELLARSVSWIRRPNTAMGDYLRQTLSEYLGRLASDERVRAQRCEKFRRELAQAVVLSRPLVKIDQPRLNAIHPGQDGNFREYLTKFPFERGHPGRNAVENVFSSYQPHELDALFGGDPCSQIDIFTFLAAPVQPVVMSSFVEPIRGQWDKDRIQPDSAGFWTWRRARPLPQFLPCAPEVRKAIIRGWFTARFLGQVRCLGNDIVGKPTEVWSPAGWLRFPWPLLGLPRRRWDVDDWMPAIIESLCLTLVGAPFDPYERLAELGRSVEDGSGELRDWVAEGRGPAHAPQPEAAHAGSPDDVPDARANVLCKRLDYFEQHYAQYDEWPLRDRRASGAWELRDDIREALSDIRQAVQAAVSVRRASLDEGVG